MRWVGSNSPARGSRSSIPYGVHRWPTTGSPAGAEYYAVRLWTLHPEYLDARGLVALWREALLAQAVLRGRTRGYRHHPQLERFRARPSPIGAIAQYLRVVHAESVRRGYRFEARKIARARTSGSITATRGQLEHEWEHLTTKLAKRDPGRHADLERVRRPKPHPSFRIVPGGIASWERTAARSVERARSSPVARRSSS